MLPVRGTGLVRRVLPLVLLVALAGCGLGGGVRSASGARAGAGTVRVSGSTTVNPVAADAAEVLRRRTGLRITVDTQGGSAGGIALLGAGRIDVAMSSKPVSDADRAAHPSVSFVSTPIGEDAVGVVVRREVVAGGLTSVTRDQLRALFEGRVRNWSALGGPDLGVFVYDKEPGRGTREVLDRFLYGPDGKAPPPPTGDHYAVVGGNEETRSKLLSTPGSVAPLSVAFVAGRPELAVLAVEGVPPTPAHVKDRTYPLSRPLFLVTDGPPAGAARTFVDFVVSAEGQRLVRRHGYLTLADLGQR